MEDNKKNKLLNILKCIITIIIFGLFGWVFFMGIISPDFKHLFGAIYRGIGCGMIAPLYFRIIPNYLKNLPDVHYPAAMVSAVAFIITVILCVITVPSQINFYS